MNISAITTNVKESNCNSKNTNSSNTEESESYEFGSLVEKLENSVTNSNDSIVEDKTSDNEIILNQYLASNINFLSRDI